MKCTEVREGLQPLLVAIRNCEYIDHFEMLEIIENELLKAHDCMYRFNKTAGELIKSRAELPQHLAEIRVLSDILVFRLGMHGEEFAEVLDEKTKKYMEVFSPKVSDDNWEELDF